MGDMKISRLFIYPIKSLLPVEVSMAEITSEGFRFDRQYVLIKTPDSPSVSVVQHLTIKTTFELCLFQPAIDDSWSSLTIRHTLAEPESSVAVPLTPSPLSLMRATSYNVSIFGTRAIGVDIGDGPATFFTKHLGFSVRLLFISGSGYREIPGAPFIPSHLTSISLQTGDSLKPQRVRFADAAPFLVTSSASENEARTRLPPSCQAEDLLVRFRSNIHVNVSKDCKPFDEDNWRELTISSPETNNRKAIIRCIFKTPRCLSLNADLKTGRNAPREEQLYGLLARDRRVNSAFPHKPVFGQYACAAPNGAVLRVGDIVRVTETAE